MCGPSCAAGCIFSNIVPVLVFAVHSFTSSDQAIHFQGFFSSICQDVMNVPVQLLATIESDSISHLLNGQLRFRPFGGVHCAGIPGHFESLSSLTGLDIHSFLPRAVPTSTWTIWIYFWCLSEILNYLSFRQHFDDVFTFGIFFICPHHCGPHGVEHSILPVGDIFPFPMGDLDLTF